MAYVQLRRQVVANPTGTGAPFAATIDWFDTATRKPFATVEDSQANDPAELSRGDEVYRYEVRPGLTRVVYYDGNGSVYTGNVRAGAGGAAPLPSTNLAAVVQPSSTYVTAGGASDACVDVTGTGGLPPYQVYVQLRGAAPGTGQVGTSPSQYYPWRFRHLTNTDYDVTVTDATQASVTVPLSVIVGPPGGIERNVEIRNDYDGDPNTGSGTRTVWLYDAQAVYTYPYQGGGSGDPAGDHTLTVGGTLIDNYLLPDGVTWRQVYTDGAPNGGAPDVYYQDVSTTQAAQAGAGLAVDNLIVFHPDSAAEQNGGLLLEMLGTATPFTFALPGQASNHTGSFDGLGPGTYPVTVSDTAGNQLVVPVVLQVRYPRPRWVLNFESTDKVLLRLELWPAGNTHAAEAIIGQAEAVLLKTDGLNSELGGQGDLPDSVGTSLEAQLRVHPSQFEALVTGTDRSCRVDYYVNNVLDFRGFVTPAIYEHDLQAGLVPLTLTATCGLASLKTTYFTGHVGQRLTGHRPWLNTILHCLSRTDVSLPVRVFTNRRDATMADTDAPELFATSNRTGYWDDSDKNEPIFQRTVLEALSQALGGTLCQRGGAWEVRAFVEAGQPTPGRCYQPAGTPLPAATAPAPTGTITPPTLGPLHWRKRSQKRAVRPGWKSLVGETDAGYLPNAYPLGKVFGDPYAWTADRGTLRTITYWRPGPGGFPLVLSSTGQKTTEYGTQWPRSVASSSADPRYLQGPGLPLVAGTEAVPAFLQITAQLVATETYLNRQGNPVTSPTTAAKALLPFTIVVDGQAQQAGVVELAGGGSSATGTVALNNLVQGAAGAVLQLGAWYAPPTTLLTRAHDFVDGQGYSAGDVVRYVVPGQGLGLFICLYTYPSGTLVRPGGLYNGEWAALSATDDSTGLLLVREVGVQLRPQGGTWDGADNFRADGPGGTVRPTETLKVYHPDDPLRAGLYGGNLYAFGKGVALADGTMSTSWARPRDLLPAPLFEAGVLDKLSARESNADLLTGTLHYPGGSPPRFGDTFDAPSDVPGRRFFVGAVERNDKLGTAEVSLLEDGVGAGVPLTWPMGVLVTHVVVQVLPGQYKPQALSTTGGLLLQAQGY